MPIWRGTISTDWNTAGNWIPDVSGSGVPSNTTDAVFDILSTLPCTTGNAGLNQRICRDLITTGHTGTLQIGSGTNGDLRVYRNATIGGTVITGSSYLSMVSGSTSTLNVSIGTTIPNLKIEPTVTSSTITLTNTTVVTNYFKTEFISGANVTFSAASAVELRVNNIVSHLRNTNMGTNTIMRFMGGTFAGTCQLTGTYILNTGATLTGTGTNGAFFFFDNASSGSATSSLDLSAGTLILTPISNTYRLGTGIQIGRNTLTLNMGTNQLDHFSINNSGVDLAFLIMQSNLVANKSFYTQFYGVRVTTNGFNIITKESVNAANFGFVANSGKLIFQGVPTASGFLGMGFVSGTTLTLTSPPSGSLAAWQTIHFPTVAGALGNVINGCTSFNSSYSLQNAQTVGSAGSPVPVYGYGAISGSLGNVTGGSHCLLEVDAGSNDTYLFSLGLNTLTTEFRYLSTNTGAFDGSKANIFAISNGSNGTIDFQGQSSPTKFINTITYSNFFHLLTLKSNLYINDFLGGTTQDCGVSQIGTCTLFVMRNFIAGNSAARPMQPTVELIGSTPANLTCGLLCANIVINKSGGAAVTVTQNFSYGYSTATTFTYTAGLVNFGATTMTIAGGCTIISPSSVGNFSFNNVTVNAGIAYSIQNTMRILGTLLCNGNTAFTGTHGWTTNTFTCLVAGSTITLQNSNASPNAIYYISTALNLTGASSASRILLQASGSATFNARAGSPSTNSLQYVSGTIPSVGMTLSQETNQSPVGFSNLLPTRPVINGGASPNFTLDQTIVPSVPNPPTGTTSMRAGYKAIFTLQSGAFQNVAYVTTQDIDSLSNSGATILSFGSNNDDVATNVFLYRTLNWGPLLASSGSAYRTWVD